MAENRNIERIISKAEKLTKSRNAVNRVSGKLILLHTLFDDQLPNSLDRLGWQFDSDNELGVPVDVEIVRTMKADSSGLPDFVSGTFEVADFAKPWITQKSNLYGELHSRLHYLPLYFSSKPLDAVFAERLLDEAKYRRVPPVDMNSALLVDIPVARVDPGELPKA